MSNYDKAITSEYILFKKIGDNESETKLQKKFSKYKNNFKCTFHNYLQFMHSGSWSNRG